MKRPSFLEGAAVALIISLAGSILFTALAPALGSGLVLRWLIAAIGLGYVLYLLRRSPERVGRITVVVGWVLAAAAIWWLQPSLLGYVALHIGLLWLVRALYFFSSLLPALADLGLSGLGLAAAVWASIHTGSLLLSLWCFFLLQALFVGIPSNLRKRAGAAPDVEHDDRFQQAHRAAEAALRRFSSIQ